MNILIGIPAFNEEKNIAIIISRLKKLSYQVLVCDDGSNDLTSEIAKDMGAMVIVHQKNLGYGAAIRSIFKKANELNVDILVTFDADGQHEVSDIERVIKPIIDKESDLVIGTRFSPTRKSDIPKYRKAGIKAITSLTNTAGELKVSDSQSGFRAYSKKVLNDILPSDAGMGVSTEILIKASKLKLRISEVPITVYYKGDTSTHNPTSHGISVILSTMKFISIEHPLKFYGIPSIIFLAIGLFFIVWTIHNYSETRQIITNISLIGIGATILGVLLINTAFLLYTIVSVVREKR